MTDKTVRFASMLLNLTLPGLGHIFCREYLFGVFIFLIMLIAAILFFVSFFLSLSFWPKAALLALPALFYVFTFVDLNRVVRLKGDGGRRGLRAFSIFLAVGVAFQLLVPLAPGNFLFRNRPEVFVLEDNSLSPLYSEGNVMKASRLAYAVNIFFLNKPVYHTIPSRYELVRFLNGTGRMKNGVVIGLPNEQVQMVDGVLIVNGLPIVEEAYSQLVLTGDCPLTSVDGYSILVATLHLGRVDVAYMVAFQDVVGRIDRLF
ncbi:MAG: hypothetical protein JSU74_00435 [Candidatus Zixiibacteriota bacterium]|nr:MAG: hypothetical protein JSU74_00435 [candidate division Zixibacteria bacterium]